MRRRNIVIPTLTGEQVRRYSFADLFPQNVTLFEIVEEKTFFTFDTEKMMPLALKFFTDSEYLLLGVLIENYPAYAPYDHMYARFYNMEVERAKKYLDEAIEEGLWDHEMRPLRNVLHRCRLKMRSFNIEISNQFEAGYLLMRYSYQPH